MQVLDFHVPNSHVFAQLHNGVHHSQKHADSQTHVLYCSSLFFFLNHHDVIRITSKFRLDYLSCFYFKVQREDHIPNIQYVLVLVYSLNQLPADCWCERSCSSVSIPANKSKCYTCPRACVCFPAKSRRRPSSATSKSLPTIL